MPIAQQQGLGTQQGVHLGLQPLLQVQGTNLSPGAEVFDSRFATTFLALVTNAGFTLGSLAAAVGVDVLLLENISTRRQMLPADVAQAIANVLQLPIGTVQGAAGLITKMRGPIYSVPYPVDPLAGPFSMKPLGRTGAPPVLSALPASTMIVIGEGITSAGLDGFVAFDAVRGPIAESVLPRTIHGGIDPRAFTIGPGGSLYTAGFIATRLFRQPFSSALVYGTPIGQDDSASFGVSCSCAYEPLTGFVFYASASLAHPGLLVQFTPPPNYTSHLISPLEPPGHLGISAATYGVCTANAYVPDVVTASRYVYVIGDDGGQGDPMAPKGAVWEIDPNTSPPRVNRDRAINFLLRGIATDDAGHLLIAAQPPDDMLDSAMHAVFLNALSGDMPAATLIGCPADMKQATCVAYFRGMWWVTCLTGDGSTTRIVQMSIAFDDTAHTATATVISDIMRTSAVQPGIVCPDPQGRVWYTSPDDGTVEVIGGTQWTTLGTPWGMAWL